MAFCPGNPTGGVTLVMRGGRHAPESWRVEGRIMPAYGCDDGEEIIIYYPDPWAFGAYQSVEFAACPRP